MTINTHKPTVTLQEIRAANERAGFFFFSKKTMRFFGDTQASFVVRQFGAVVCLERVKPMRDTDGRNMGGVGKLYRFNPETGDVRGLGDDEAAKVRAGSEA
jgi:hypothetical protein